MIIIAAAVMAVGGMAQSRFYKGNSTYSSDILYSFDGKYIYNGRSTYSSDILYTYDGKYIYNGRSNYSSDILYSFDSRLPLPVLLMML